MKLNIDELIPGMILEQPINRSDGTLVLKEGSVLTARKIIQLKTLKNIEYVTIDSSKAYEVVNAQKIKETVSLQTKFKTVEALKKLSNELNDSNIQNVKANTKEIVKNINDDTIGFNYDLESYMDKEDIQAHSVRVACFSIVLAKIYNNELKRSYPNIEKKDLIDLEDIAIAALLHDMGVICKDSKKLNEIKEIPKLENIEKLFPGIKDTPLDKYDERYNSVYSYCLVGNTREISNRAKNMILLSNEPESEKGCLKVPFRINSQRHPAIFGGKIIRTCDIYDKVMNKTIEQGASLE